MMGELFVKKVVYKSKNYYRGLNYLIKNYPNNTHLLSCYEGISFRNLARYIKFDKTGKIFKSNDYLERPRRFILITDSKKIEGVMVTISLPEFNKEIGYEDYVLIDTKTTACYKKFLDQLSFDKRTEIVAFNTKQIELVKLNFSIKKIHCWSVFASQKKISINSIDARLMDNNDLGITEQLSKKVPEESSPFRLLKFQLNGLPYKNYIFSFNNNPSVFIGVCPYSTRIFQVNYLIKSSVNNAFALAALETVSRLIKARGYKLIWRLREKDIFQYKALIMKSSFVKLTDEHHLHLKFIGKNKT